MFVKDYIREPKELPLDMTLWRYMTFPKFISLLTYQALWFSKLKHLEDGLEGLIPATTKDKMRKVSQESKDNFPPELHPQFDAMEENNEKDGRNIVVANSWFISEDESLQMWEQYATVDEGVAIKTTFQNLRGSVFLPGECSQIGRVKYIDHATFDMGSFKGQQPLERAFIKDKEQFEHEKELRLATLNLKTPYCVKPDGVQYKEEEVQGKGMNNFENPGLYVGVKIDTLFDEVVVCPQAQDYFYHLAKRLIELYQIKAIVRKSSLSG